MRKLFQTSIQAITLTGASQEIWSGNPRRRGVCLFVPSGLTLTLSLANPAVALQGLIISNQTYPYIFDWDRFGDFCTKQVLGISSIAGNAGILEIFDDEETGDIRAALNSNWTDPGNGVPEDFAATPFSSINRVPNSY